VDLQEFYRDKRIAHNKLVKTLLAGEFSGQPKLEDWINPDSDEKEMRPVSVYLVSVRKREAGTVAGHVCLVPIWDQQNKPGLASERIADGTHRVATSEEIQAYLQKQVAQKRLHDSADVKNSLSRMQIVGADQLSGMPEHLRELAEPATKKK
jgi:hypothetical protein